MSMLIDFHTHILPGIDDGSRSMSESLNMLRAEAEQNVRHIVATPHFYASHDSPERFLSRRATAETRIREALLDSPELPEISIGAEVYFFPGISDSEVLSQLTIDRKKYILLEMPNAPWTESMYRELEGIYIKQGLVPIIAHMDRYIHPLRTYGIPERLSNLPVLVQANANFFLRRTTVRMAMRLLKEDKIHLLGSDCHNMRERSPNLGVAIQQIERHLGQEAISRIECYAKEVLFDL